MTTPLSLRTIGQNAFLGCTGLTNVVLSEGVEDINRGAFYNCTKLSAINFPETLRNIYGRNYNYNHDDDYGAFESCTALKKVEFPSSLDTIGRQAFQNSTALDTVTFGEGLSVLAPLAFSGCTGLKTVSFPEMKYDLVIDSEAFLGCTALNSLNLNKGIVEIGWAAFRGCTLLKSVDIPDTVKNIRENSFADCAILSKVTLHEGLEIISGGAFYNCPKLRTINIPNTVTTIGGRSYSYNHDNDYGAFESCPGLIAVGFTNTTSTIGRNAFNECSHLADVYYYGTQDEWLEIAISDGNDPLTNANIHYSSSMPDIPDEPETDTAAADKQSDVTSDADTQSDVKTDTEIAAETDTDTQSETDTQSDTDSAAESDTQTDSDTETDTQSDSSTDTQSDAASDTDTQSDSESDTDSSSDSQADSDTDSDDGIDHSKTFFFDPGSWDSRKISFYITDEDYDVPLFATQDGWVSDSPWGSKKTFGTKRDDGLFESFEINIPEGHTLYVIFYDVDTGIQTFECVLTEAAYGDTAELTGNFLENPVDSTKICPEVKFRNSGLTTPLHITSTGKVQGSTITSTMKPAVEVAKFVFTYQDNKEAVNGDTVANAIEKFNTNPDDVWNEYQNLKYDPDYDDDYNVEKESKARKIIFNESGWDILEGDVDGDGDLTSNDALLILRGSLGMINFTDNQRTASDFDQDGVVTSADAILVLRESTMRL